MRTVLNVLNFILGGFATTFAWLLVTLLTVVFVITLPLTRSCWEITHLSFIPFGNEAIHTDLIQPDKKNHLFNSGRTIINIFWFILFGWWLCLSHITVGIVQCLTIIGLPTGIAHFKIAVIALWPAGLRVVSVEAASIARQKAALARYRD